MADRCTQIPLQDVNWEDQRFSIHSFAPVDRLRISLERCGVITPPWVLQTDSKSYIIVDGHKRFQWLRDNGVQWIDCIVADRESDAKLLLLKRIEGKLFGPALNLAEKAQIIAKLLTILPAEQVLKEFFPPLGLVPKSSFLDKWRRLAAAESQLLEAMAKEIICERAALELIEWTEASRSSAVELLSELRCSASIQMEILERITEIALGQGRERHAILHGAELRGILTEAKLNHRQKTQAMRDLLSRHRFPRLSVRQQRFLQDLAAAALPPAVQVIPPQGFEGNRWQMQLSFSSPEELQELAGLLRQFAASPRLTRLISP